MAILDTESFAFSTSLADYFTYGVFATYSGANNNSIITSGPLGDNYLYIGNTSATYYRVLTTSATTIFAGFRVNLNSTGNFGWSLYDSGFNNQITVLLNTNGSFTITANGTTIGSTASVVPTNGWVYIEVGAVIGSSGSVTIKMNGLTTLLTLTGVNTQGASSSQISYTSFYIGNAGTYIAHYYVCDNTGSTNNTFLGDVRVQGVFPSANSSVAFTHNGLSANYLNVSQVPPVPATDYNSSSTVGATDTFTMPAIGSTLTTVLGIAVKALVQKTDAGSRSAETVIVSGTATATSSAYPLGLGAQQIVSIYQTDPNTGVQWTQAGLNASKPGYKVSS